MYQIQIYEFDKMLRANFLQLKNMYKFYFLFLQFEALIQPESLKTLLALGSGPATASLLGNKEHSHESRRANDLDSAESKTNDPNNSKNDSSSSEEEDDNNNSGEDGVTMLKLPVELSFQEVSLSLSLFISSINFTCKNCKIRLNTKSILCHKLS